MTNSKISELLVGNQLSTQKASFDTYRLNLVGGRTKEAWNTLAKHCEVVEGDLVEWINGNIEAEDKKWIFLDLQAHVAKDTGIERGTYFVDEKFVALVTKDHRARPFQRILTTDGEFIVARPDIEMFVKRPAS